MAPRKPRKPQAVDALATKIAQWVAQYNLQNDPYLTGLLAAIEGKKDLHIWAELDPNEYLPHPDTDAAGAKERLVRLLTVIRNVLVFAPVALTWAAVSAATTGSGVKVGAGEADGVAVSVAVGDGEVVALCETGSSMLGSLESSSAKVGAIVEIKAAKRVSASVREMNLMERLSECQ
jgi:hypothetical protein